jgi:4-coumarate--CoA ligase
MLFVVDRKKDVLKVNSMQVNLSEVENVVQSIEGVDLVSIVGIPDDVHNNLLTAAIVRRKGFEELSEATVIDFVASAVPEFKRLHGGVFFFETLPMTPSGKIQRRLVLEEILKLKRK